MTPSDAPQDELTLRQLLNRALQSAEQATSSEAPGDAREFQLLIASALSQLALCASLILHLSVLSSNETLDDLTAASLRCILVPALQGECELQVRTKSHGERKEVLQRAQLAFQRFLGQVHDYEIVPEDQRKVLAGPSAAHLNAATRREAKIAQYKAERELKARLVALEERKGRTGVNDPEEDGNEADRQLSLSKIRLHYVQANAQLSSIDQELEILSSMPVADDQVASEAVEEDLTWRLDRLHTASPAKGPILSAQGKVLRPFTILPSTYGMDARIRLQDQVFGPGYRLPTMTVDEYLAEEEARGNILKGGGAAGEARQEAEKADRVARLEGDNLEADRLEEEDRQEKLQWDDYRDTHRRGDGNRLGRG